MLTFIITAYHSITGKPYNSLKQRDQNNDNQVYNNEIEEFDQDERENEEINKVAIRDKNRNNKVLDIQVTDFDAETWVYREYLSNHYLWFHLFMILNSIYISVVFTNWSFAKIGDKTWRYDGESYYIPMVVKYLNATVFGL